MGDEEDLVFPCEGLAHAIRALLEDVEIDFYDEDLYQRMHARKRHNGQVLAMVGARNGNWYGLKVPKLVNEAASLVWRLDGRRYFFGDESWRAPAFRAAVRANADPDWAMGFLGAVVAARALGGPEAELAFVHAEFPPFETAEDRRRRWEDERLAKERELFNSAFAQEEAA